MRGTNQFDYSGSGLQPLRRGANDYSKFDQKSVPATSDRLLIEDVSDGGKKKWATVSDVAAAIGNLSGAGTVGWCVHAFPLAPQALPTTNCWCYAQKVWLPAPFPLHGYGWGLTTSGLKAHGALYNSIWTHDYTNNKPSAEYTDCRVVCFHQGLSAGFNQFPKTSWTGTIRTLSAGLYWILTTMTQTSSMGIVTPPIDWLGANACGYGNAYAVELGSTGGYLAAWPNNPTSIRAVPAIYLV